MKAQEFRDLSEQELELKEEQLRKELFDINNELKAHNKRERIAHIPAIKRDIARVMTVRSEKQKQQQEGSKHGKR